MYTYYTSDSESEGSESGDESYEDNESINDRRSSSSSSMVPLNRKNSSIVNRKNHHENRQALSIGNGSTFGCIESNGGDSVVVLTSLIQNAVNSGNNNAALYFSNSLREFNQLSFKRMDLFCDAVNFSAGGGGNFHQSSDQRLPQYNSSQYTMVNTSSNASRSPSEDFNIRRIYSNNVFSGLKQAHVSDQNFKYIVSLQEEPFIKGNCLHNVFQMLLRIKRYWLENDMVVEEQDYEMREFSQRRETKHPKKEKAHMYSLLYVDKPSIDMNDIISVDVSLIENLIRFLYHLTSNYAYFVMENEDEELFKNLSKSVRLTRLKNLKKEFPKRTDYIKANNMDDVSEYKHRCTTGKGRSKGIPAKQRYTEGSEKYLSMYQNKDLLTLPFIRKLYQWMLEKYIFCLSINVESDDLYVTIENNNYPIIKENHNSAGDGQRMNYRTILKHILSLLGLYEPLKTEINVEEFDFFDMLGIQTKVDGRKNNGKGKRKRSSDSQEEDPMTGKRPRRRKSTDDDTDDDDDNDDHDDEESSSDNDSYVNDLEE